MGTAASFAGTAAAPASMPSVKPSRPAGPETPSTRALAAYCLPLQSAQLPPTAASQPVSQRGKRLAMAALHRLCAVCASARMAALPSSASTVSKKAKAMALALAAVRPARQSNTSAGRSCSSLPATVWAKKRAWARACSGVRAVSTW